MRTQIKHTAAVSVGDFIAYDPPHPRVKAGHGPVTDVGVDTLTFTDHDGQSRTHPVKHVRSESRKQAAILYPFFKLGPREAALLQRPHLLISRWADDSAAVTFAIPEDPDDENWRSAFEHDIRAAVRWRRQNTEAR